MNIKILDYLERFLNSIVKSIQDQIGLLNTNLNSQQTSINTIQNTNLPSKVDKVGVLNGDGSYVNALTGDFEYGTINGSTTVAYRGIINIGSRLRHYGDTVDPADIVNVQFVNNKIDPVRNLALLAIKRTGDNVSGTVTSPLTYNFSYCNFIIDSHSTFTYNGLVTFNSNVSFSNTSNVTYDGIISAGNNIVNKNYVDTEITQKTTRFYFHGRKQFNGNLGDFHFDPTDVGLTLIQSSNFNTYFSITTNKFTCVTDCVIRLTYDYAGQMASHYNGVQTLSLKVQVNSTIVEQKTVELDLDNTNNDTTQHCSIDIILSLTAGDVLQVLTTKSNSNDFATFSMYNKENLTITIP